MAAVRGHLPPLPTIREIIHLYKLQARKQLSQNFLMDMNLTRKIVRAAGNMKDGCVCEVGPGPGGITRAILNSDVKELVVIEKDHRFMPGLQMLAEATNKKVRIFHGDVLRFNMENIFPQEMARDWTDESPNIHIIGNLPFNVSTPLIIQYFRQMSERTGPWSYGRVRLTLTFQKEVAERLVAPERHEQRCRLSIMSQHLCYAWHKFDIPGRCFVPPPKVDVGVVTFAPLKKPKIDLPFDLVEKVVRHTFQFRQKMIKKGLVTLFPRERSELLDELLQRSNMDPAIKSYMLSVEDFNEICQAYKIICDNNPDVYDFYFRSQEEAKKWKKYNKELH